MGEQVGEWLEEEDHYEVEPVNDSEHPWYLREVEKDGKRPSWAECLKTAQYYHKALIDSGLGRVNTLDI